MGFFQRIEAMLDTMPKKHDAKKGKAIFRNQSCEKKDEGMMSHQSRRTSNTPCPKITNKALTNDKNKKQNVDVWLKRDMKGVYKEVLLPSGPCGGIGRHA
jgi:hypothetical protein